MTARRSKVAFIIIGIWLASAPGLIPIINAWVFPGTSINVPDWLALWALAAGLGAFIIFFGLTVKPKLLKHR